MRYLPLGWSIDGTSIVSSFILQTKQKSLHDCQKIQSKELLYLQCFHMVFQMSHLTGLYPDQLHLLLPDTWSADRAVFVLHDLEHTVKPAGGWSLLSCTLQYILVVFELSILPRQCSLLLLSHWAQTYSCFLVYLLLCFVWCFWWFLAPPVLFRKDTFPKTFT